MSRRVLARLVERVTLALVFATVASCSQQPTELLLSIDSDLLSPEELDTVTIRIESQGQAPKLVSQPMTGEHPSWPLSLVVASGGASSALTLTVMAQKQSKPVVSWTGSVPLVAHESRLVHIPLVARCLGNLCSADQTCSELGCRSKSYQSGELSACNGSDTPERWLAPLPAYDPSKSDSFLVAGGWQSCWVREGIAYCWGKNDDGQLGMGFAGDVLLRRPIPGLEKIRSLALGAFHGCACTENGQLSCWGQNDFGQLGVGTGPAVLSPQPVATVPDCQKVVARERHGCVLTRAGQVSCWGDNAMGQVSPTGLSVVTTPTPIPRLTGVTDLSGAQGGLGLHLRSHGGRTREMLGRAECGTARRWHRHRLKRAAWRTWRRRIDALCGDRSRLRGVGRSSSALLGQ